MTQHEVMNVLKTIGYYNLENNLSLVYQGKKDLFQAIYETAMDELFKNLVYKLNNKR